jgi:hypothetical protein
MINQRPAKEASSGDAAAGVGRSTLMPQLPEVWLKKTQNSRVQHICCVRRGVMIQTTRVKWGWQVNADTTVAYEWLVMAAQHI